MAILYVGGTLACRRCQQLAYESQHDSGFHRLLRRARAIRLKLGGSPSLADPFPEKPNGMHWRTYSRLYIRAAGREQAFLADTLKMLTAFEEQISRFKTQGGR